MEQGPQTRRDQIVEAMILVAGDKGYLATSVADVIAEADVSRTTFYKHFGDKRECFLAAYDLAVERIVGSAEAGCGGERTWLDGARGALVEVVDLFAAEPALGRMAIVEVAAAGAEARRRHSAAIGRLGRLLDSGRDECGWRALELPPFTGLMAVGAVAGLILDELREGQAGDLPRILPELEFALLVPYLGPRDAGGLSARSPQR
jgi:AcrR family transcriptional regulator